MKKNIIMLSLTVWLLTGCVAGQHLKMDHSPSEPKEEEIGSSVALMVDDNRSYVLNGEKEDYYIGHYRAGFGNTWDVTTYNKVPLKEQIESDVAEELSNMGFANSGSGKTLSITILEWNFDGYQNGRFWYEIKVDVLNDRGDAIATSTLKEEIVIDGTVMGGAKAGFEREMPGQYDKIIDSIVRSNKQVLDALKL